MATDPVRRIREFSDDAAGANLAATLVRLAALPPSLTAPYVSVSLDWSIEGGEPGRLPAATPKRSQERAMRHETGAPRRPAWAQMQRELESLVASYGPRGAIFDSLTADLARLTSYVEQELDPAARGAFIVACQQQGVFEAMPLDIAPASSVVLERIPALRPLVHAAEDFPAFLVLNADQQDAFLWLMQRQSWSDAIQIESTLYPRKQASGGLNQQRYQRRADERMEAFARTISDQLTRLFLESAAPPDYLIISSEEPMAGLITAELHKEVAARVIGRVTLDITASPLQIAAAAAPLVEAEERREEEAAVQAVSDGVGAQTLGMAGAVDTLRVLAAGQVRTLVMNDDFSAPGWADYTLGIYGVGDLPQAHPAGGDVANLVATQVEDEAVRLALLNGGEVELVQSAVPVTEDDAVPRAGGATPRSAAATALDGLGGIGAVLRYSTEG